MRSPTCLYFVSKREIRVRTGWERQLPHLYGDIEIGEGKPHSAPSDYMGDISYLIKVHKATDHSGRQEERIYERSGGDKKDAKDRDGSIR